MQTARTWAFVDGGRYSTRGRADAVPTADNLIPRFNVSGAGKLIGVGNGDPHCQESDKEPKRSLFSGLAQVIPAGGARGRARYGSGSGEGRV